MFNPMPLTELVAAMGRTARDVARSGDPADPFARAQLLSVYSATRHAAVEMEAFDPELRAFARAAGLDEGADAPALGDATCELLKDLRRASGADAVRRRDAVRAALAALADREVELLADAIEGRAA